MNQEMLYGLPALCSIICYWNSLKGQLVHDDIPAIKNNLDLRAERGLYNLLLDDYWGKSLRDNTSHKSYRPVTVLTFRWNYYFHGIDTYGYHLVNVILHAAVTCLVIHLCISCVFKSKRDALLTGCLFAVHPIHTEAVASIVGRADVICALFYILTILCYERSIRNQNIRSETYFTISCLCGGLAMLSKEQGITSLPISLLIDMTYQYQLSHKRRKSPTASRHKRRMILIAWISILLGVRLLIMNGAPIFLREDNPASFEDIWLIRALNYCYIYSMNIVLLIYPSNLCHDWSHGTIKLIHGLWDARNIITLSFLFIGVALIVKAIWSKNSDERRIFQFAILMIIVPYLPATNILFHVGFVIAERILYIPSIGICILIVHSFNKARQLFGDKSKYMVIAICAIYALKTMHRNKDWSSRETLARAGVSTFPNNAKLQYNYANVLKSNGLLNESVLYYKEALRLWPEYSSARNNLATALINTNLSEAKEHLLLSLHYNSEHANSYFNLGNIAWLEGKYDEAIRLLHKSLDLDSNCYTCHLFLSAIFDIIGMPIKTKEHFQLAVTLSNDRNKMLADDTNSASRFDRFDPITINNVTIISKAEIRAQNGDHESAIHLLTQHVNSTTENEERARVYFLIGECYKDLGGTEDAINWYLQTLQLIPDHADAHHNLAVAYHKQKNITEANHHYKAALELNPSNTLLRQNFQKFEQLMKSNSLVI